MLLIPFFVFTTRSTLKNGENPYHILDVNRDSTDQEIKAAYRKITMKHHPDVSKNEESSKIWVKATDAYELLMDSNRRSFYDRTGSVSEEVGQHESYSHNGGQQNDIFNFFFGRFHQQVDYKTEHVSIDSLNQIIDEKGDCIIFIYNSRDFGSSQYGNIYEQVASEFSEYITFLRNDIINGQSLAIKFQLRSVPAVMYVKRLYNGEMNFIKMSSLFRSRDDLIDWIKEQWDSQVSVFTKVSQVEKWLSKEPHAAHILQVCYENEPSFETHRVSSHFKGIIHFAVLTDDYVNAIKHFKLKSFPSVIVFNNGKTDSSFDSIKDATQHVSEECFFKLNEISLSDGCHPNCIFKVGEPNQTDYQRMLHNLREPIGWVGSQSSFAKTLGMLNGDWAFFDPVNWKYFHFDYSRLSEQLAKLKSKRLSLKSANGAKFDKEYHFSIKQIKRSIIQFLGSVLSSIGSEALMLVFFFVIMFLFLCIRP